MPNDEIRDIAIPRSTLLVGGAFWAVLFGMTSWLLLGVVDLKQAVVRIDGKLDAQTGLVRWNAQRVETLEQRQRMSESTTEVLKSQFDSVRARSPR